MTTKYERQTRTITTTVDEIRLDGRWFDIQEVFKILDELEFRQVEIKNDLLACALEHLRVAQHLALSPDTYYRGDAFDAFQEALGQKLKPEVARAAVVKMYFDQIEGLTKWLLDQPESEHFNDVLVWYGERNREIWEEIKRVGVEAEVKTMIREKHLPK